MFLFCPAAWEEDLIRPNRCHKKLHKEKHAYPSHPSHTSLILASALAYQPPPPPPSLALAPAGLKF